MTTKEEDVLIGEFIEALSSRVFQRGYDEGVKDGQKGKISEMLVDTYTQGLNDTWEAAKKIILGVNNGGLADDEIMTIFNKPFTGVLVENTATEVVTKIRKYEEKQKQTENCLTCKWNFLYYEKYLNVSEDEKIRHCRECYRNSGYESMSTERKSCSILEDDCPYDIECEECEVHCSIERARKKLKESK